MKLTHIEAKNFLGARDVNVALTTPITLICGANGSGKSSVMEGVRLALTGEPSRVILKKDYARLVTEGEKSGFVTLSGDRFEASVVLPSGKRHATGNLPNAEMLPYVLDAPRFARLDDKARREFLFGLMEMSADAIGKRLSERGYDPDRIAHLASFLRAGHDVACKEAEARARDEKATWRTLTGETYGEKKAATWRAEKPEDAPTSSAPIEEAARLASDAEAKVAEINQTLGALKEARRTHEQAIERLSSLREKGARFARVADKLACDEEELKKWEEKVSQARINLEQSKRERLVCPHCDGEVTLFAGRLSPWKNEAVWGEAQANAEELKEFEEALRLMKSAVANDKRDLASAEAAAQAIKEAESAIGAPPAADEIEAQEKRLASARAEKESANARLTRLRSLEKQARLADETTARAQAAHQSVTAWLALAAALAPDGIPGEILTGALDTINDRLAVSSELWGPVALHPDMRITYAGRDYALLSESEKWRTDAVIAEAVSHLFSTGLLVLDRFDVLDAGGRSDLILWLIEVVGDGTALLFGTLKSSPSNLPEQVTALWIENGVISPSLQKEAAP